MNNNYYGYYYVPNNIPPKKKKKIWPFVLLGIFLFLVLIGVGLLFLIKSVKSDDEQIKTVSKDYNYLAKTTNNDYIIKNASTDITFYVTEDSLYTVKDSKGNVVNTKIEDYQIINPSKYKKGETYTIELSKGKFVSNQLKDAQKVTFTIARDEVKKYQFKSNTKEVKSNDIQIINNTIVSKTNYEIGDVLLIKDKDAVVSAYVINNKNNNNYTVRKASIQDIYSELDVYYEDYVDLSNYEVAKDLKDYLVMNVEKASWYNALVDEAYAKGPLEVELEKVDNGIKANFSIDIEAGSKGLFIDSDNHDITLSFTQTLQIKNVVDVTLTNYDVTFDITSNQEFEFKINNQKIAYEKLIKNEATEEILKQVNSAITKKEYLDTSKKELPITDIMIPTAVPGLSVDLGLSITNELNSSISFTTGISQTSNIVMGFDYGINEQFKPVAEFTKETPEVSLTFAGEITDELGIKASIGVNFVGVVKADVAINTGMYAEAKAEVKTNIVANNTKYLFNAEASAGVFIKVLLEAELLNQSLTYNLIDKKIPIVNKSYNLEYPKEQQEEKDEIAIKEKYLEDKNLDHNSCILYNDDNSYTKYHFNYDNGKLKNILMINTFNVNTGYEWLDNLYRFLIKIFALYFKIYYHNDVDYIEKGTTVYLNITIDKDEFIEEENLTSNDTDNYLYWKSVLESNGFTCS